MEATTSGKFMVPEGDKVYPTFLDMLRDQPPNPDVAPLVVDEAEYEKLKEKMSGLDIHSKTGVIAKIDELMAEGMSFDNAFNIAQREQINPVDLMSMAIREEAGFPLDKMEEHDAEFKKMYDEMFARQSELGKLGAGDIESRMSAYQNELSASKTENLNGGRTDNISAGGSAVHSPKRPSTPLYYDEPAAASGTLLPAA